MSYQQEIVGAPFFAAPCIDDYTSVSKSKKLSWCWQTRATRLEVSQGHQT